MAILKNKPYFIGKGGGDLGENKKGFFIIKEQRIKMHF